MGSQTYESSYSIHCHQLNDQVWVAWDKGKIDDQVACIAWLLVATGVPAPDTAARELNR